MSSMLLQYPVTTLDGTCLLEAGTLLDGQVLNEVASRHEIRFTPLPLMQFATVETDLAKLLSKPPYLELFLHREKITLLLEWMRAVHLAPACLETLAYFRQHDFYTYRHILMVFALTTMIAHDLLPDSQARLREALASPIHDIGKICVPLEILKKRTPLTRSELNCLEHHTLAGCVLLSYYLQDAEHFAVRVARDHHERKNGSGYPRGISDLDPLVEIIVVSDIYDALVSPRPYRPVCFDSRTAIEEITRLAEEGEIGWYAVKALVAHHRHIPYDPDEVWVSSEKRGHSPPGNLYRMIVEDY